MPLTDYTFKLSDIGIELNTDVADPFVDILRVYGFDSAPIRETVRDHEGVDGGFMDAEFEQGRPIMFDGEVYGSVTTLEPFLDSLKKNWAPSSTPVPLYFKAPGVEERLMFVKPRGLRYDWAGERRLGIERVQFVGYAEDPRIYSNSLQGVVITLGGFATTGIAFSFGFNLNFGATAPIVGGNVVVTGNRPTPAICTISGPVVNPSIINMTTGLTLAFVITLGAADTLVVDLANHTVLLNGTENRRNSLLSPNWFLFNPGTTNIVFTAQSGSGELLIQFRNAWR